MLVVFPIAPKKKRERSTKKNLSPLLLDAFLISFDWKKGHRAMRSFVALTLLLSVAAVAKPSDSLSKPAVVAHAKSQERGKVLGFFHNSFFSRLERSFGRSSSRMSPRTSTMINEDKSSGKGFGSRKENRWPMNANAMRTSHKSGPTEDYLDMLNHALYDPNAIAEEEARLRRAEAAAARARADEEARHAAKERRKQEEEARQRAEEEARAIAEKALKRAEEEARAKAEIEARHKREEEARLKAEIARKKADEEARAIAQIARIRAEEAAKAKEEEEARRKAQEQELRAKDEAERRARAEEEASVKARAKAEKEAARARAEEEAARARAEEEAARARAEESGRAGGGGSRGEND